MIKATSQSITFLALVLSEAFLASTKWAFPFFACSKHSSILKSIRSNIVPCSITSTFSSLNSVARSLVALTISSISLLLAYWTLFCSFSWNFPSSSKFPPFSISSSLWKWVLTMAIKSLFLFALLTVWDIVIWLLGNSVHSCGFHYRHLWLF